MPKFQERLKLAGYTLETFSIHMTFRKPQIWLHFKLTGVTGCHPQETLPNWLLIYSQPLPWETPSMQTDSLVQ